MKAIQLCMTLALVMLMCASLLLSLLYIIQRISAQLTLLKDFYHLNYEVSLDQHHNSQENVVQLNKAKFNPLSSSTLHLTSKIVWH